MEIKVFTWNVLSGAFFKSSDYPSYHPEIFNIDRKTTQVLDQIEEVLDEEYIVTLYEVCDNLKFNLIKLAIDKKYVIRDNYYNHEKSGNMGAVLMWPEKYKLLDYKQVVVGQHIFGKKDKKSCFHYFYKSHISALEAAKSKHNVLFCASLQIENFQFNIAAYHMPCAFQTPEIMKYHLEAVYNLCNTNHPLIICMDMNTTPKDPLYKYLEDRGMSSSNKSFFGKEPEFTINTQDRFGEFFKDAIDYVWIRDITVNNVELPTFSDLLPSFQFPSDHYWMKFKLLEKQNDKN